MTIVALATAMAALAMVRPVVTRAATARMAARATVRLVAPGAMAAMPAAAVARAKVVALQGTPLHR